MKAVGFLMFLVLSHHGLMQIFRLTASIWLVFVGLRQSRQAASMLQLVPKNLESGQSVATSVAKTKRYYAYSAFIYIAVLCIAYLVVGGRLS